MYQLAILGNPVEHSLSPVVFNMFAKECGVDLNYIKILANDEVDFVKKAEEFFNSGGTAINITSPFKRAAYMFAKFHTARSSFSKASNFITYSTNGELIADTTDGLGILTDLEVNQGLDLKEKKILIIGSGYVLDSILMDLIPSNPQYIDILARNNDRVEYLSNKFATGIFDSKKNYDIILNSTPNVTGNKLFHEIDHVIDSAFCYDLTYAHSRFLNIMKQLNPKCRGCNGLGMLIEQAKVAFIKLFGHIPDSQLVFDGLAKMGYHV